MKKEKKFKVTITDEMFFEDLIWMSYRYCIGRKTIAASMHAGNIAKNAYQVFSKERQTFMAHDIRREINDCLTWLKNVKVSDYRNHIPQDALSSIIYRIFEKYGDKPPKWVFTDVKYTVENEQVMIDKSEESIGEYDFMSYYHDLIGWIKLANLFDEDCYRIVVVKDADGEEILYEHKCFPYPYLSKDYNGNIIVDKKWVPVEHYLQNPFIETYVDSESIIEIKEIE